MSYQRFKGIKLGSLHFEVDGVLEGGAELGIHVGCDAGKVASLDGADDVLDALKVLHQSLSSEKVILDELKTIDTLRSPLKRL